jgi:hypothetical protein
MVFDMFAALDASGLDVSEVLLSAVLVSDGLLQANVKHKSRARVTAATRDRMVPSVANFI